MLLDFKNCYIELIEECDHKIGGEKYRLNDDNNKHIYYAIQDNIYRLVDYRLELRDVLNALNDQINGGDIRDNTVINAIPQAKAIRIEDVMGEGRRTGKNIYYKCPLHNEKTGSFVVDTNKNMFKCFGCGEYGDVIDLVMKRDGLGLKEAVDYLLK